MGERALVGAAAVIAGLSAVAYFAVKPVIWFGDAKWYPTALPALRHEQPLYPPAWLHDHVVTGDAHFNLPPATALFAPIASLGDMPWGLLMIACAIAGLVILWPRRLDDFRSFLLVCGLVAWWPLLDLLAWANINALVFLLLAVALRWPRYSGVAIGVAAAIKASPILFLAVLIGRRQWRQVTIAIATGGALTLLVAAWTGPDILWHFVELQVHETHPRAWHRLSASNVMPQAAAWSLALLLAAAAVWRRGSWWLATAAVLVSIPALHLHYWVWFLVPALGWLGSQRQATECAAPPPGHSLDLPATQACGRHHDAELPVGSAGPRVQQST